MNRTWLKALLALGIVIGIAQFHPSILSSQENINSRQFTPNELMLYQRSYPSKVFDIRGYEQAIHVAQAKLVGRKTGKQGFDRNWTLEGPTNIGGRLNAIAIDPSNKNIIYTGSSTGGIFKTTDGGTTWNPIFDDYPWLSIGCLTIDPQNNKTIYAGTGDVNISGNVHIGDGVYKSTDAGATWKHLGLDSDRIISKIVVHPKDSKIIYAATMGNPFLKSNDRGLYKSTDGGANWKKVLFLSNSCGIIDLVCDPNKPDTIYTAGFNRVRTNYVSTLVGPLARIYRSFDGGSSWDTLTKDIPSTGNGRIGIAHSSKKSGVLYSVFCDANHHYKGLWKTTNYGTDWKLVSADSIIGTYCGDFGWYFSNIFLNPLDDDDVMLSGVNLYRSQDGGANWFMQSPIWWTGEVHADKHALVWYNKDSFLLGTDGGLYTYNEQTATWRNSDEIPNTEFYHVTVDQQNQIYYGGAQDNGSIKGNKNAINDWTAINGGDGFKVVFDPADSTNIFSTSQYGNISNVSLLLNFKKGLNVNDPLPWDIAYYASRHSSSMFAGSYRVYKNDDTYTPNWYTVSKDLTDGGDHAFHNISCLEESPISKNIILAGTSDGRVWKSMNSSKTWIEITGKLPKRYITHVYPSPADSNTIYVAESGYKFNDFTPHIFKSTDLGATWKSISGDLPPAAINNIWAYEKYNDSMLFIATDVGVYGSTNAGLNWYRLGANMPMVPVTELGYDAIHKTLVASTYARSMMSYPMDSIIEKKVIFTDVNSTNLSKNEMLFPNPAHENIYFKSSLGSKIRMVEIYNLSGEKILCTQFNSSNESRQLNILKLENGTYIVKLISENNSEILKFIKY